MAAPLLTTLKFAALIDVRFQTGLSTTKFGAFAVRHTDKRGELLLYKKLHKKLHDHMLGFLMRKLKS